MVGSKLCRRGGPRPSVGRGVGGGARGVDWGVEIRAEARGMSQNGIGVLRFPWWGKQLRRGSLAGPRGGGWWCLMAEPGLLWRCADATRRAGNNARAAGAWVLWPGAAAGQVQGRADSTTGVCDSGGRRLGFPREGGGGAGPVSLWWSWHQWGVRRRGIDIVAARVVTGKGVRRAHGPAPLAQRQVVWFSCFRAEALEERGHGWWWACDGALRVVPCRSRRSAQR